MKFVLIDEKTNRPVNVGDTLTTHDGEKVVLTGWSEPYDADFLKSENFLGDVAKLNPRRGAKIYCQKEGEKWQNQWYPSVCGLKFVVQE